MFAKNIIFTLLISASCMEQINVISIPAMTTSGTLPLHLPGPGQHHAALHGGGID